MIFKENLSAVADLDLGLLLDSSQLAAEELLVPRQIDTQASFVKKGTNWVISASGGVEIHPWQVVGQAREEPIISRRSRAGSSPESAKVVVELKTQAAGREALAPPVFLQPLACS